MKKILTLTLAAMLAMCLLAGCGGQQDIPDGMDADALEASAKAMVDAVNAKDYETVAGLFSPDYPMSAEQWAAGLEPHTGPAGAFKQYKSVNFATVDNPDLGKLCVVVLQTEYENQTINWQVSFTTDYEIVGLVL